MRFLLCPSSTKNLSFGERPVCTPVRTTKAPPSATWPSPRRIASSYSAGTERFQCAAPRFFNPSVSSPILGTTKPACFTRFSPAFAFLGNRLQPLLTLYRPHRFPTFFALLVLAKPGKGLRQLVR